MLKKYLVLVPLAAGLVAASGAAWATVDINTATEAQLQELKGIGPSTARAIVKDRTDHGPYKSAADLSARVKGLGPKSLTKLEAEGLSLSAPADARKGGAEKAGKK